MPDGRISYKTMIGKTDDGKARFLQVYQRKGESPSQLKARFDSEVERFLAAKSLLGIDSGIYDIVKNGSDSKLSDFMKRYLEDYKKPTVKSSTYAFYRNIMVSNINPYLGEYKLNQLRPIIVQSYVKKLCDKGLAFRTVKGALQLLKSCLAEAVHNELIEKNPAENIKIPKKTVKKNINVFTREEQKIFMNAIKGHIYEVFFTMAITTGMRCGEMLGLTWENIDFDKKVIHIRQNLTIVYNAGEGNSIHIGTPKSAAGVRTIPISDALEKVLKMHKEEHYLLFGNAEGFVFKTNKNEHFHSKAHFSKALKTICIENGLPVLNIHALRHTFATRGLEAGIMPRTMQRLLGHEDTILFNTTYSHVLNDIYAQESEKLIEAINKINSPVD